MRVSDGTARLRLAVLSLFCCLHDAEAAEASKTSETSHKVYCVHTL